MIKTALYQLFVPMGRTRPKTFWTWLAVFAVLVVAFDWGLGRHPNDGAFYFWGFLIWLTMLICGVFGIYGKRLKDFGRSVLMIILAITALLVLLMVIMLGFGGAEYFAEYGQYERKATIDPAVREAINARYTERMAAAAPVVRWSTGALMVAFTLWVGLSRGDPGPNRYGPAPEAGGRG